MGRPPQSKLDDIPPNKVQDITTSLKALHDLGQPQSDEECEQRINEFFELCRVSSVRPAIESLCLSLHISRQTLHRWSRGENCSIEKQQMIQSAMQLIYAFLEQAGLNSQINPVSYIFLCKNYLGYSDQYSISQSNFAEEKAVIDVANLPKFISKQTNEVNSLPQYKDTENDNVF